MGLEIGNGFIISGVDIQFEYPLAPTNIVAPIVTGSTTRGNTLSTTTGTWQGVPNELTYQYQWQRGTSNIAGATSNLYTLTTADVNNTIRSSVIATNIIGSNTAYSANTAIILPNLPSAPTSVNSTSLNSTSATVTWVAPSDTGGGTISSYTIIATSTNGKPTVTTIVPSSTSGIVPGLVTGGIYVFSVAATNQAGTGSYGVQEGQTVIVPAIGESFGGGIVIITFSAGCTVAATTGGNGFGNWSTANNFCNSLSLNGFDDWFMPNQTQVNAMYSARSYLSMSSGEYWTSTVAPGFNPLSYYTLSFPGGLTSVRDTTFACYVRAIRAASY